MIRHAHVDAVNSASCCAMRPAGRISNGTCAQGLISVNKKNAVLKASIGTTFFCSKNTNDQMEEGLCLMPDSPYSVQLCAAPDSDKACRLLDFLYGTDRGRH